MPIYEYQCRNCGTFEHSQSIKDKPLRKCPRCRHVVKKLVSASSFQLKGGGWYSDGYAKKGAESGTKAGESAGSSRPSRSASSPATPESPPEQVRTASPPSAGRRG